MGTPPESTGCHLKAANLLAFSLRYCLTQCRNLLRVSLQRMIWSSGVKNRITHQRWLHEPSGWIGQALQPGGGSVRRLVAGSVIQARKRIGAPHLKQFFMASSATISDLALTPGGSFVTFLLPFGWVTPLARFLKRSHF